METQKRRGMAALSLLLVGALFAQSASAVTINITFRSAGQNFSLGTPNPATSAGNTAGGGTLQNVMAEAASWWEGLILDVGLYNVDFGWVGLLGANLAVATQFNVPQPGTGGTIRFDSRLSTLWFADNTPGLNEEYSTLTQFSQDLGAGAVNVGRVYTGASGAAAGRIDLLSVAKHEIGHLLGVANTAFGTFTIPNLVLTTGPAAAGSSVPTTSAGGGHINLSNALMFPSIGTGIRRDGSDVDIGAVCTVNGFQCAAAQPVPEPGSLSLLAIGLLALVVLRLKSA